MRWESLAEEDCSIARALAVVGDRWTMLILRNCFLGMRRFEQLQNDLEISPRVLTDRLGKLVDNGMLERQQYSERPTRFDYRLTDKGRDFYPVIANLLRWGDRWETGPEGPSVQLKHRDCGHRFTPTTKCSECGGDAHTGNVRAEFLRDPRRGRATQQTKPRAK